MNKPNKRWLIIGLCFIVGGYVIASIFRFLTPIVPDLPQTELVTQNLNQTKSTFQNLVFTGEAIKVPKTFKVVPVLTNDVSAELKNGLATAFNLVANTENDSLLSGGSYYLSTTQPTTWLLGENTALPSTKNIPLAEAIVVATTFNSSFIQNNQLQAYSPGASFYEADEIHFTETSADQANLVSVPFTHTIDGLPLFFENQNTFPIIYYVSGDGEVTKATINPFLFQVGEATTTTPSLSVETALANINQNQGAIISSTQSEFGELRLEEIVGGTLSEVKLEYRVDQKLGLAYPFYRFKGTVTNSNTTELAVEIITPAVATKPQ